MIEVPHRDRPISRPSTTVGCASIVPEGLAHLSDHSVMSLLFMGATKNDRAGQLPPIADFISAGFRMDQR